MMVVDFTSSFGVKSIQSRNIYQRLKSESIAINMIKIITHINLRFLRDPTETKYSSEKSFTLMYTCDKIKRYNRLAFFIVFIISFKKNETKMISVLS